MKKEILRKAIHSVLALSYAGVATYAHKELPLELSLKVLLLSAVLLFVVFLLMRIARVQTFAHRVSRVSYGELFFPLGIAGALLLSWPDIVVFQTAMFVLAIADPLAALIGKRYGKNIYHVYDEKRSVEGSVTCALVLFCIFLLFGNALYIAGLLALALTVVEAIALRGSDNLFLPLATVLLYQVFI